jgi:hypothetical protein
MDRRKLLSLLGCSAVGPATPSQAEDYRTDWPLTEKDHFYLPVFGFYGHATDRLYNLGEALVLHQRKPAVWLSCSEIVRAVGGPLHGSCNTCQHFSRTHSHELGRCRRAPPQPRESDGKVDYPIVLSHESCPEYQASAQERAAR